MTLQNNENIFYFLDRSCTYIGNLILKIGRKTWLLFATRSHLVSPILSWTYIYLDNDLCGTCKMKISFGLIIKCYCSDELTFTKTNRLFNFLQVISKIGSFHLIFFKTKEKNCKFLWGSTPEHVLSLLFYTILWNVKCKLLWCIILWNNWYS